MEIQKLTPEVTNFQSCKFRSENEHEKLIKRCSCKGGNYIIKGYYCEARDLFQIDEEICAKCEKYQSK